MPSLPPCSITPLSTSSTRTVEVVVVVVAILSPSTPPCRTPSGPQSVVDGRGASGVVEVVVAVPVDVWHHCRHFPGVQSVVDVVGGGERHRHATVSASVFIVCRTYSRRRAAE